MSLDGITAFVQRDADETRRRWITDAPPTPDAERLMEMFPVPVRVWRPLEDTAARFAAPWWALVWVLSLGRMGAPLWRWEVPRPNRAFADMLERSHRLGFMRDGVGYRPLKPTHVPLVPSPTPPPGPSAALDFRPPPPRRPNVPNSGREVR